MEAAGAAAGSLPNVVFANLPRLAPMLETVLTACSTRRSTVFSTMLASHFRSGSSSVASSRRRVGGAAAGAVAGYGQMRAAIWTRIASVAQRPTDIQGLFGPELPK